LKSLVVLYLACTSNINADAQLQVRVYFAMGSLERPEEDASRDYDRRPIEVMEFFGIDSGMTVLELMSGTGYYTEMLAAAVNYNGKVFAHNNIMTMRVRNGAIERAITGRLAENRLPNVKLLTKEITELELTEEVDVVTLILNLHDLYIFGGEEEALNVLISIMQILRPGGALGIVEHIGSPDQDNNYLHRIDPVVVEELLFRAGFIITGRSKLLANTEDDHSLHVFDPKIQGKTDRMVIRAIKPNFRLPQK